MLTLDWCDSGWLLKVKACCYCSCYWWEKGWPCIGWWKLTTWQLHIQPFTIWKCLVTTCFGLYISGRILWHNHLTLGWNMPVAMFSLHTSSWFFFSFSESGRRKFWQHLCLAEPRKRMVNWKKALCSDPHGSGLQWMENRTQLYNFSNISWSLERRCDRIGTDWWNNVANHQQVLQWPAL